MTRIPYNKPALLVVALALSLVMTAYYCYGQLTASRAAFRIAAEDLTLCHRIASDINHLRGSPTLAKPDEPQLNELTRHIELSAKDAGIPLDLLVRIWPDPVRRMGGSPYKRKSTQVLFRQITLRQIITFLHTITAEGQGPLVTHITLTATDEKTASNHWTAETTLTHLIYDPKIHTKDRQ